MKYMQRFSLKGKKCVVTGAASPNGIGFAVAEALAEAGGDVIISDIDERGLKENAERLRALGIDVHWDVCDIADRGSVERHRDFVLEKFGSADVLVNNSGAFQDVPVEDMEPDEWKHILDVNLTGNFNMSQVFGREMIKLEKGGSIIFISSKSGFTVDTPQHHAAYNTSKAGIIMLAKCLAVEWARYGIRVNCIAPGNIASANNQKLIDEKHPYIDAWVGMIPMRRLGSIEELGNLAIYLAADSSSYVTGETILADGGYCAL
ncbi:MAG: SDR family oxidoreductase [Oscillospiraceae bacterium]|nr:SDR family oxidoreductase [Oscillospiraceae bacterium]